MGRPSRVTTSDGYRVDFVYDADGRRKKMTVTDDSSTTPSVVLTRIYLGSRFERDKDGSGTVTSERLWLGGDAYSAPVVLKRSGSSGNWTAYNVGRDLLGSVTSVQTSSGTVVEQRSYDPWGRARDPQTLVPYSSGSEPTYMLGRGFTGHEWIPYARVWNANARLYDPILGRFLSPDPYVQEPGFTQNYNRFAYVLNSPLKYTDPSGELFGVDDVLLATIVGAVIGAYSGGVIANEGQYSPLKWNWKSTDTYTYMFGGALVGGVSGYLGSAIAASGIPLANTSSIMAASLTYSIGTYLYTGGRTPISVSFGVASYDFTNDKWGFLGRKGNGKLDDIGYVSGLLGNISDVLLGPIPQKVDLVTEHSDYVGHSAIVQGDKMSNNLEELKSLISVGPDRSNYPMGNWHWMKGTNQWNSHNAIGEIIWRHSIDVNYNTILKYSNFLNKLELSEKLIYSVELSSCVTHTSIALNLSGVFNIGIHLYILSSQMYLWSHGIRPWSYSYYLTNK